MARGKRGQPQSNGSSKDRPIEVANRSNRDITIRAAVAWVAEHMAEVKKLNAEIAEYKAKHIKGDLGWKLASFNAVLRAAMLEDDDRDSFMDQLREGFAALGVGGQLDWIKAADSRSPPTVARESEFGDQP